MSATSRSMVADAPTRAAAEWQGQRLDPEYMMPAGGKLDNTQFGSPVNGRLHIPSGTGIGRTFAERAAGTPYGLLDAADDDWGLIAYDVVDAMHNDDVEIVNANTGFVVKENRLPGWAGLGSTIKAKIRAGFKTTLGA